MYLVILTSLFYVVGGQDYEVLILGAGASGLCKKNFANFNYFIVYISVMFQTLEFVFIHILERLSKMIQLKLR